MIAGSEACAGCAPTSSPRPSSVRWPSLGAGAILVVTAFAAAMHVADTRDGLIYEVVTLLAGLAGVGLLLYGLVTTLGRPRPVVVEVSASTPAVEKVHNAGELLVGAIGLAVAAVLVGGIAATEGLFWALLGAVLLLPMIAGCVYLCVAFARAPRREWKIDLQKLRGSR
jgi:hypothetical protein